MDELAGSGSVPTLRQCPRTVMTDVGRNAADYDKETRVYGMGRSGCWPAVHMVQFSPVSRELDLFLELIHLPERELFDSKRSCEQKTPKLAMTFLLAVLDFLFGCHHVHLSRVFTLQGETYRGVLVTAERSLHIRWKPCRSCAACHSVRS